MSVLRPVLSACLLSALWTGTVLAQQNPAEPQKQEQVKAEGPCAAIFAEADLSSLLNGAEIAYRADGCTLSNVTIDAGTYQSWSAETVEIRSAPLEKDAEYWPEWGEISIKSVGYWPTSFPGMRYLSKIQQNGFDLKLAYQWDESSKTFRVNEARFSGKYIGEVLSSATVELSELPRFDILGAQTSSLETMKIREISTKLDDQGFFANYVMATVVAMIGHNDDPEPEVEKYRAMALAFVAGLSAKMIDAESKQALSRLISDLPHPKAEADINLKFDPAFSPQSSVDTPLAMLGALQKTLTMTTRYAPVSEAGN
ncbi:hypothetical protein P8H26_03535 [Pseudochrobactrum sp. sp1633]|uniref:hypothetical protein n=1 Tax=Pseudochrobactrum sp. sp1633 TaxID=3036706 RepID=UPI0025A4ECF9|nr:hypothetical protein [Pseudochrobactrum sp. sp1633]MDM8344461.1 hypothetical protein [Pseudochrobactrum sp. sp1633]HWD14407.1 hypothetical protein [Pseudochrobactrum sp.]